MIKVFLAFILGLFCFVLGAFMLLKDGNLEGEKSPLYSLETTKKFEEISSEIVLYKESLWLISNGDTLINLDARGELLASYKIPLDKLADSFLIEDNILYARSSSAKIFAYDLNEKSLLWSFDSSKKILADLILYEDFLIFGSYDFKLYILDKNTGNVYFEYEGKEAINDKVLVSESKIYFGDCAGVLTSLDIKTKEAIFAEISEHLPSSPVLKGDSLFIADYENTIISLDKNTLNENYFLESDAKKIYAFDNDIFALSSDLYLLENSSLKKIISLDESLEFIEKISDKTYALISNYGTLYICELSKNAINYEYKFGVDIQDIKALGRKIFILDRDNNIYILKKNEQ